MANNETSDFGKPLKSSALIALMMLISRVLGFVRDMSTAAMMGMSGSIVADAFFLAFRFPNLGRRLIEEGALGLSWIPAFSQAWHSDRKEAWRLLAAFLRRSVRWGLPAIVLGELAALGVLCLLPRFESTAGYTVVLFALMLPYFYFALLTAQCAATLQATGRFGVAASVAMIFNICWLVVIFFISPFGVCVPVSIRAEFVSVCGFDLASLTPLNRAAILAVTIVVAAAVQFLVQRFYLARLERRDKTAPERPTTPSCERTVTAVFKAILPTAAGLLFVQFNTLFAVLIASAMVERGCFASGTATAIYYAERLYEFPLGLIGVAVGTAFYPLLVRRAAQKDFATLSADLATAVKAVLIFSIPAAVGLYVLARPLAMALFVRGDFTCLDAMRTSVMIGTFALGVPIFCLQPILIRTFYAQGDYRRPIGAGVISTCVFALFAALLFVYPTDEDLLVMAIICGAMEDRTRSHGHHA